MSAVVRYEVQIWTKLGAIKQITKAASAEEASERVKRAHPGGEILDVTQLDPVIQESVAPVIQHGTVDECRAAMSLKNSKRNRRGAA